MSSISYPPDCAKREAIREEWPSDRVLSTRSHCPHVHDQFCVLLDCVLTCKLNGAIGSDAVRLDGVYLFPAVSTG